MAASMASASYPNGQTQVQTARLYEDGQGSLQFQSKTLEAWPYSQGGTESPPIANLKFSSGPEPMQLIVGISSSVNPSGTDTDAVGVYRLIRDSTDSSSQNQDQWSQLDRYCGAKRMAENLQLRSDCWQWQSDSFCRARSVLRSNRFGWKVRVCTSQRRLGKVGDDILGSAGDDMSYIDMSDDGMTLSVASQSR